MRYVFFGTPEFSAIILDRLIRANMPPSLVVTNPDKPVGRKQILTSPPVREVAQHHGIPVVQPDIFKTKTPAKGEGFGGSSVALESGPRVGIDCSIPNQIRKSNTRKPAEGFAPSEPRIPTLDPHYAAGLHHLLYQDWDFFLVVAYGKIIPKNILEIPRLGVLNVHPSLLPKYRGPTPIQTAILNGDKMTGVSIMLLDEEVDHGPILKISNFQFPISNETYAILSKKLAELGAEMLQGVLPKYVAGKITPVPQEHTKATFTKKFTLEDAFVPYEDLIAALEGDARKSVRIDRMIRALNPEPGVWTKISDKQVLDLPRTTFAENSENAAGINEQIIVSESMMSAAKVVRGLPKNKRVKLLEARVLDGKLILKQVQIEGQVPRNLESRE